MKMFCNENYLHIRWRPFSIQSQCEEMPAPLSVDIRWRIVWLTLGERMGPQETALLMGVTEPTIYNIVRRFRRNGSVRSSRIGRPNIMSSLNRNEANILMEYVFRFPGVYLREAVKYIDRMSEGHFSAVSLWRCLKRHNFSRKKVNM